MPGGRSQHVPASCKDASGRTVPIFNPAMRFSEPPAGTDFTLDEWNDLRRTVAKESLNRGSWWAIIPIGLLFTIPAAMLIREGNSPYLVIPFATAPLWLMALLLLIFRVVAGRSWGVTSFVDVPDKAVIRALLKRNRCPSCAYRLPCADKNARATCSECGAIWRSNVNSSLPPPPSPCTSPAPSQDPPR